MLRYIKNQLASTPSISGLSNVGISIEIPNSDWYQSSYGMDIVQAVISVLERNELNSTALVTEASLPIVLSSFNQADIVRLSSMTDLPLVQGIFFNNSAFTYDYNDIAQYANAVKCTIG